MTLKYPTLSVVCIFTCLSCAHDKPPAVVSKPQIEIDSSNVIVSEHEDTQILKTSDSFAIKKLQDALNEKRKQNEETPLGKILNGPYLCIWISHDVLIIDTKIEVNSKLREKITKVSGVSEASFDRYKIKIKKAVRFSQSEVYENVRVVLDEYL